MKQKIQSLIGVFVLVFLTGCSAMTSVTTSQDVQAITTRQSLAYQELTWSVATVPNQNLLDISVANSASTPIQIRFSKSPLSGRIIYRGSDGAVLGEEPLGILSTIVEYEVESGQYLKQRITMQSVPEGVASITVEIVCQVGDDAAVTESLEIDF